MNTGVDFIRGFELANMDPERFDTQVIEVSEACKDCEYLDRCITPGESVRQLTPKKGKVLQLASEKMGGGDVIAYYALVSEEDVRYIRLKQPKHYWASACYIPEEQVPPWMLTGRMKHLLDHRGIGNSLS